MCSYKTNCAGKRLAQITVFSSYDKRFNESLLFEIINHQVGKLMGPEARMIRIKQRNSGIRQRNVYCNNIKKTVFKLDLGV